MAKKSGNFFEQNVDKIVLGVIGLICVTILILMVLRSPNTISVNNKSYGPGEVDKVIADRAKELEEKLSAPVKPRMYASQIEAFRSDYRVAVDVPEQSQFPLPAPIPEAEKSYVGPYSRPQIESLGKPIAGVVSGVAGIPLGSTPEAGTEPGDVDLVTIQSTFNPSAIYTEMARCFRDSAELQQPLFAAVELQRQEMNEDGTWPASDAWTTVKRTKVDPYRDILDIENVKTMPVSEAAALRAQLSTNPVAIDVLQPIAYIFQSRTETWLPPELEDKRAKINARLALTGMMTEGPITTPTSPSPTRTPPRPGRTPGPAYESEMGSGRTMSSRPMPEATRRLPPTMPQRPGVMPPGPGAGEFGQALTPEGEFQSQQITNMELLRTMPQVVFWAHDDATEPGKTYRYRMRFGILNPIAGRGRSTTDPSLADTLIFWSNFTGDTSGKDLYPVVDIPARMYVFPLKYRESDNTIVLEVAKYDMARWEKKQYEVKVGEIIGRMEKMPPAVDSAGNYTPLPDVDFSTGMTVVDVKTVTEYNVRSPNPQVYQQMLYSGTDNIIKYLAFSSKFWPKSLSGRYNAINLAINNQPAVPVSYTGTSSTYAPGPAMPYRPMGPGMREEE